MNTLPFFPVPRCKSLLVPGVLSAVLGLASTALAAPTGNIVLDPGFESATGGATVGVPSSLDGGTWNVLAGTAFVETGDNYVYAGNNSLNLTYANIDATTSVAQTLATTPGTSYFVSFFANSDSANTFSLTANGVAVAGIPTTIAQNGFPDPTSNSNLFVDYTGSFYATSTSTVLDFTGEATPPLYSQNGSVEIDNVSVQPTPEPESLVLLLTGMAGLGTIVRRRLS